ncbi:3'-5' ssDNA/RNA exonuclease TatD [Pseudidiomarina piscicola]|uniref:3'-5' ssDNA/RNA exonuclease TatD n=1 Tax=Pseudidiomarina piscicola TaxID=2614830 RepID=A0A6S6WPX9_9GAMM|nr:TatD family hydrolase [Pseudidiomarina piscicola]CAB0151305.1 3'-5' ssDNA/RNA exonuclease TatD [Pseudidiomarina piscicola]VZT40786.1 3'-5' ssDNA/RNA exonuclease TatD [Pseudomonas aeruginosa]
MTTPMWFDAGVNLTHSRLAADPDAVIAKAEAAGVERMVVIACNLEECEQAIELAEQHPMLIVTAGVHPHDAKNAPSDLTQRLREFAQHPAVHAIGECGLDFNRNYSPPETQLAVFEQQLEIAAELQLPVYLHERDAFAEQYRLLQKFSKKLPLKLVHCFTSGCTELKEYLKLDCYIGITGWVCDERRGDALRQAVPMIPSERLILETDAPFLIPRTLKPRPSFNEPCWLPEIAKVVAELRGSSMHDIAAAAWQNSHLLFGCDGWQKV